MEITLTDVFVSELMGTAMLVLLGCGVVANVVLPKTKGNAGGWLLINFGWGLAVFAGVYVSVKSGAHINPAVTVGMLADGRDFLDPLKQIDANIANAGIYFLGQLLGGVIGATLAYLTYKKHFDEDAPAASKLAVFSTNAEIRSNGWNFLTEVIGTFVLVFVIFFFAHSPAELGALPVALLVVGIGASLGGPTGYAINPARDLGPRIAHALLPVKGKGGSDWSYAWVPVAGPIVGGLLAGFAYAGLV